MNAHTLSAKELRKCAVALVSIVLLAAAGSVYSITASDELQLACQGASSCGG